MLLAPLGLDGVHLCNQLLDVVARSLVHIERLSCLVGGLLRCTMKFSANSARGLTKGMARRDRRELGIRVR